MSINHDPLRLDGMTELFLKEESRLDLTWEFLERKKKETTKTTRTRTAAASRIVYVL